MTATAEIVAFCFHSRHIGVIDIRSTPMQAILGISMEEHGATNMCYHPATDTLCLFGVATKEGNSDSLLFLDGDGSSRKYVFRRYRNFLRVETY
jgi:hypothetical protein